MHRIEDHSCETSGAREWDVPIWFWSNFTGPRIDLQFWDEGRFEGDGETPTGRCNMRLAGLYIARDGLEAVFPSSIEPEKAAQSKNAGGRPRADYWDDLWCEISGAIHRGDLQPKTQADLERWMLQWASDHDHEPGESTVRLRARKLFKALNDEGKNLARG